MLGDRLAAEETREFAGVIPFLQGLADDPAVVVSLADAIDFLVQHRSAHEGRGVAAGIADLGPAHGFRVDAVIVAVPLALPGVLPEKFTVELADHPVDFQPDRRNLDHPFQRMQAWPGHEGLDVAGALGARPGQLRIMYARRIAHACEQSLSAVHPQRIDQFLAQRSL